MSARRAKTDDLSVLQQVLWTWRANLPASHSATHRATRSPMSNRCADACGSRFRRVARPEAPTERPFSVARSVRGLSAVASEQVASEGRRGLSCASVEAKQADFSAERSRHLVF